ncbi:MAG: transposase [Pseudoalteromonas sp.]|nr:transposase [Pseudoalteromonas sp.]
MQNCSKLTDGSVVSIYGKMVKGLFNQIDKKDSTHIISALASQNGVKLGQGKTDSKSYKITAIPELLELKGCLMTIDSMGYQKGIA